MSYSRRDLITTGLKATLGMAMALKGLRPPVVRASNSDSDNETDFDISHVMEMASFVVPDPQTLGYMILGPCCQYCYDEFVVHHYQPVAFVEVTRAPSDSFTTGEAVSDYNGTVSGYDKYDHTFSARVWDLPETAIEIAFAYQACKLCGKPEDVSGSAGGMIDMNALEEFSDTLCSVPMGEVGASMQETLNSSFDSMMSGSSISDCIPTLLYDSGSDEHWRSGCRDITQALSSGPLCEAEGNGIDLSSYATFGEVDCVGEWGSVYPRQMRVLNHDVQTAAAMTAYRAIHVARNVFETFPYDASLKCKLQQTVPNAVTGYFPGTDKVDYNEDRETAENGRWVFVWWVPVGCCKDLSQLMGLCTPSMPCM